MKPKSASSKPESPVHTADNDTRIVFLNVPPSLKEDLKHFFQSGDSPGEGPVLDESIPLPIQIEAGKKDYAQEDLTWEMILAAMIKIVSDPEEYGIDAKRTSYYRNFVLALKPEIYNELSGAAIIKARNGDFEMSLEIITLLEGLFPGNPGLMLNRALILEDMAASSPNNEELDGKVIEAYEEALSQEQVLPEALFNAGFFFLRRREYRRALECLSDYLSFAEPVPGHEEKLEKAAAAVRDIESRGLDDSDFLDALELIRAGEAEEGLGAIKSFLERRPLVWNGWFVLGWALRLLGRWQDSLESLKKAAELGGGTSDTRNEMAICLLELGDIPAARRELENALREDPENISIISNLGIAALKSGDKNLAAGFFRTVLELDPEDAIARSFFES